jgi:hypothetical protein
VDMFPDRDRRFRRVLAVWPLSGDVSSDEVLSGEAAAPAGAPLAEQEDGEQHGRQGQHGAEEGDVPGQG